MMIASATTCLCRTHADGEKREECTLKLTREQQTVEDGKVEVDCIEHQLDADEHGNKVAMSHEAKHANKE